MSRVVRIHAFGGPDVVGIEEVEIGAPCARRVGAQAVALTRTSAKVAALRDHGAAEVIATTEQDLVAEVRGLTGGEGADLVFDPVAGPAFAQLVEATGDGGTLILNGALDGARPTALPQFDILARGCPKGYSDYPTLNPVFAK